MLITLIADPNTSPITPREKMKKFFTRRGLEKKRNSVEYANNKEHKWFLKLTNTFHPRM